MIVFTIIGFGAASLFGILFIMSPGFRDLLLFLTYIVLNKILGRSWDS